MDIDILETAARSRRKQGTTPPPRIDPERDVDRVRQRDLKQSKIDLVERLLIVEQAYAEKLQQLARLHFELVEYQQKRAEGRQQERQL